MTLANTLLEKLTEWQPLPGRQTLHAADAASGWSLQLTADRSDALGCLVWELTLGRTAEPLALPLGDWAGRLTEAVTGLLEPLKVVEVDAERQEGFLRSGTPVGRGSKRLHYELFLRGTREVTLRRFQAAADGPGKREQIAFAATHENLAKIVEELLAAV